MTVDGKRTAAVVLAAGSGKRMGTAVHKQYLLIKEEMMQQEQYENQNDRKSCGFGIHALIVIGI